LNEAKAKAGKTIYGKRVALIASEFIKPRKARVNGNRLENPGFEASLKVDGWRLLNPKAFPARLKIATIPGVMPHSGKNCLLVVPEISQNNRHRTLIANSNPISMKDGEKIKYSLWVKGSLERENVNPYVAIVFYRYNKDGKYLGGQWTTVYLRKFNGQWQKIEGVAVIRNRSKNEPLLRGTGNLAVDSVVFTVDVMGKGQIYIDDAKAVPER